MCSCLFADGAGSDSDAALDVPSPRSISVFSSVSSQVSERWSVGSCSAISAGVEDWVFCARDGVSDIDGSRWETKRTVSTSNRGGRGYFPFQEAHMQASFRSRPLIAREDGVRRWNLRLRGLTLIEFMKDSRNPRQTFHRVPIRTRTVKNRSASKQIAIIPQSIPLSEYQTGVSDVGYFSFRVLPSVSHRHGCGPSLVRRHRERCC